MPELNENEARVNITYAGYNADLPDPVFADTSDVDLKASITEALVNGDLPGIPAQEDADLGDYVVRRFDANETRPWRLISIHPKTPFGL